MRTGGEVAGIDWLLTATIERQSCYDWCYIYRYTSTIRLPFLRSRDTNATSRVAELGIHRRRLVLGLLCHIDRRKKEGQVRLLLNLPKGEDDYYSSTYSKYFNSFLKSISTKTDKNAFHSFRHNFEHACRGSDVSKDIMDALQGHGDSSMVGRYGSRFTLKKLNEATKKIQYKYV